MEDQIDKGFASNRCGRLRCLVRYLRKRLSKLEHATTILVDALQTILRIPVLLGLFAIDIIVVLPLGVCSILTYGALGVLILTFSQTPIIYLIVQEVWRMSHLLPKSEAWETSPERWREALKEFVETTKHD